MEDANHNVALIFHLHQGVVNMMEVMMGHGSSQDVANRRELVEKVLVEPYLGPPGPANQFGMTSISVLAPLSYAMVYFRDLEGASRVSPSWSSCSPHDRCL
jgi:hypothetical protein